MQLLERRDRYTAQRDIDELITDIVLKTEDTQTMNFLYRTIWP